MSKLPPPRKFHSPAEEINLLHAEILHLVGVRALEKAIRIGELLTQEKAKLDHGQWLPWIEKNLRVSRDTTANYMRVYERRDELKCKAKLTFTDAVKLLAEPEPAAGGRLKSRIKADLKLHTPKAKTAYSSEEARWKQHEDETKQLVSWFYTVEGTFRSLRGFDDPFWNQVDLDAALSHLKEVRKCLTVLRQPATVRSKLPPPPKKPTPG